MSLDSDVIVDRRRIRRKLTFWRVAAVLMAIAAIVTVGVVATPGGRSALTTSGSIARVHIDGLIRSDNDRVEALERLEKSRAAAVVVHINSPTTGGEAHVAHGGRPVLRQAEAGDLDRAGVRRHHAEEHQQKARDQE